MDSAKAMLVTSTSLAGNIVDGSGAPDVGPLDNLTFVPAPETATPDADEFENN